MVYDTGCAESFTSGDAFYSPPGHTSWKVSAGSEMVMFSPADQLAEVEAAIAAAMHAAGSPNG